MKKIEIKNEKEVLKALKSKRIVKGRLTLVETAESQVIIAFIPYNVHAYRRKKDELICWLDNGWVKRSATRIKVHESIPEKLGMARIISILDQDIKHAKNSLIDEELSLTANL